MTARTALIFSLVLAAGLSAQDWNAFRGPNGDGSSTAKNLPIHWDRETNVKWKVKLPRAANGSPIVVRGRIFLTCPEDEGGRQRSLYCYDREDGRRLWVRTVEIDAVMPTHKANPYCGSTPAADGQRVIVWHASAGLYCYDFAGEELWKREFGEFRHQWGYGTSPMLHDGRVYLYTGPGKNPFLIALDPKDGKTIWKAAEPPVLDTREKDKKRLVGSWCTPIVARVGDEDQIICTHPTRVVAYRPRSGDIVWTCDGVSHRRGDLAYSSPVIADDVCVVIAGYMGPAIGIRLGGEGDVTESHRLWRKPRPTTNSIGSGVFVGGHVYDPDSGGRLFCIEPETGKATWAERPAKGQQWGSIVYADGRLYLLGQRGTTIVFKPNPQKFELMAKNELAERTNSTLAVSDGEIFIRTHEHLYCIAAQ